MKKLAQFILMFISIIPIQAQNNKGIISGKVVDKVSKEALPGVNVILVGTNLGTATNENGEFTIKGINVGTYQLRASAIGFNPVTKSDVIVNSARPVDILFELSESPILLEGVTVKSGYFDNDISQANSVTAFNYEEIRRTPGGFEDVVRALSVLPGVAQASPGRNDLVVRGGAPSENLYVVDGFVVPNINHFGNQGATGGPLSYINLDFVRETTFSTGGFPAKYGDKLSSVLKINLRNGRSDKLGGKATISASQFGLNLEGPITDNSEFIFSSRRSYLDFIFNAAGFNFVPEYYDLLTKYSYNFDQKHKLSFLFIGAFDRVKFNNNTSDDIYENSRILGSNQTQYITGLSYQNLFDKGFLTISLSRNYIDYDSSQRDTLFNPVFLNKSSEAENELKADLVYKFTRASEFSAGVSAKLIKFNADILLPNFVTTFGDTLDITSLKTNKLFRKYGIFVQYSNTVFDKLNYTAGLRADYFNGISDKFYLSPRFSISYMIDEISNISFSTGIYYQSPSYIWLAAFNSNENLKAVNVKHYIAGYERKLVDDLRIRIEGFYKDYNDYPASILRPYLVLANTGAGFGGGDDNFASFGLEKLTSSGKGHSEGIELSIQKKSSDSHYYGIGSVTFSKTYFTGLDGIERPGTYDQNLIINLTGGYLFSREWEGAFKFRFATGNPYTPFNADGTQSVIDYNTRRFKSFYSLDLRVDKRWFFEGFALVAYLDIQNITNNKNSNSIRWDYRKGAVDEQSSIGILPSIGISLEF